MRIRVKLDNMVFVMFKVGSRHIIQALSDYDRPILHKPDKALCKPNWIPTQKNPSLFATDLLGAKMS